MASQIRFLEKTENQNLSVNEMVLRKFVGAMHTLEGRKNLHQVYNDKDSLLNYRLAYTAAMTLFTVCNEVLGMSMGVYLKLLSTHFEFIHTPVLEW
jgi:hypothetical protein